MAASEIYAGFEGPVVCDPINRKVSVKTTTDRETILKRVRRVKKSSKFWQHDVAKMA